MTPHRVAVMALDGVTPMVLAIPTQIFSPRPETPYHLTVCGLADRVATTGGLAVAVEGGLAQVRDADTVVVPGLDMGRRPLPAVVLDTLAEVHARGRRIVAICSGAFALAEAGVLDGLRGTTHWEHVDELERDFPAVQVVATCCSSTTDRCSPRAECVVESTCTSSAVTSVQPRPIRSRGGWRSP